MSGAIMFSVGTFKSSAPPTPLIVPENESGGLTGWGSQALSIPYSATVIATYPVGTSITWYDNTRATIIQWDDYGPTYIDLYWTPAKSGQLFQFVLGLSASAKIIPRNAAGGLTGWGAQNASFPAAGNSTLIATYPVGTKITFRDNTTSTVSDWVDYGSYIDIGWATPKSGNIFPIVLG
jgi:hypothetical protein